MDMMVHIPGVSSSLGKKYRSLGKDDVFKKLDALCVISNMGKEEKGSDDHSTAGHKRTRKETTSQKEASTPNTSERIAEGIEDGVSGTRKEGGRGGDHLMGRNILGRRRGRMGQNF